MRSWLPATDTNVRLWRCRPYTVARSVGPGDEAAAERVEAGVLMRIAGGFTGGRALEGAGAGALCDLNDPAEGTI